MISEKSQNIAQRATALYESSLRERLEASHRNSFVAIEPESGEYFIGETLSAAIQASREKFPDRLAFGLRVGHSAAVSIGVLST